MNIIQVSLSDFDEKDKIIGPNLESSYSINKSLPWVNWGASTEKPIPNWLVELNNSSPTSSSLIKFKSTLTSGNGFLFDEKNDKLKSYIEENDLNEVLQRAAMDYILFGAFSLNIIWAKNKKDIANITHLPVSNLRVEQKQVPEYYFISPDWTKWKKSENEPVKYQAYNPENIDKSYNQIIYYFNYKYTNPWYPVEDYRGGLNFIQLEKALGTHWLANTQNGMVPSGVFNINGPSTEEQRQQLKKDLKNQYSGPENSGKLMVLFSDGNTAPTFVPLSTTNNADIYNSLNEIITQKIISSHSLNSPSLAGLPSAGSIFTNEISTAFEYFTNTVIKEYQKPILKVFGKLFKQNNLIKSINELAIEDLNPNQFRFSENVLLATLTQNELRAELSYPPVEGGDVTVRPVTTQPAYTPPMPGTNSNTVTTPNQSTINKN